MSKVISPRGGTRTCASGCFRFDRIFGRLGVGRIQISSGTRDPPEFRRRDGILTELADTGRTDILHALRDGETTITELALWDQKRRLRHVLDDVRHASPLPRAGNGRSRRRSSARTRPARWLRQ